MHRSAIVLFSALVLCHAQARADEVVTLGMSGPLTGGQASTGKDNENGAKLALQDLAKQDIEIAGKKVTFRLMSEDDQADPKVGVQVAQKIVDAGATVMLGPNNSGVAIPVESIFTRAGVPVLVLASNPEVTNQGFNNVFRTVASDSAIGGSMAQFAKDRLKAKTAAVIDDRTAYGAGVAAQFTDKAKSLGIDIVSSQYTNSNAVDFKGILTEIKDKNPDIIFYGGYLPQAGPLTKQLKQLGLRASLLGGDGFCSPEFGKLVGPAGNSVYCGEAIKPLEKSEMGRAFSEKYKAAFGSGLMIFAVNFYDSVFIVVDAMKRAGTTTDKEKIRQALAQTNYDGIAGHYSFDAKGNLINAPVTVFKFKDGTFMPY